MKPEPTFGTAALAIVFGFLLLTASLAAQVPLSYYLPTNVSYDEAVPSPQQFFGFQIGEWHLRPDQIDAYMTMLASKSDRVLMQEYGKTHESRSLNLLVISSPENIRNITAIKKAHRALSNSTESSTVNISAMPAVVWMGYSVHGNEPSGANATPLVAYYLAAAQGAEAERILRHLVVILVPVINPDGLARFAHWANTHKGKNLVSDPNNREHHEAWPGGRFNHYWFDLNRDWMPLQHPESQARAERYYEWMPNLLTDHHEMGSNTTYFFQPGVPTRNNPLTPQRAHDLTRAIADYHAAAFDSVGGLYFTREFFDDYYIGKGSSYPDLTGSIGILFEQASSRGHRQESVNGVLDFHFTIRNQVLTSFSTLRAAVGLREELLKYQRDFFVTAAKQASQLPIKAYVFGSTSDPERTSHFIDLLHRHRIDVYNISNTFSAENKTFSPGTSYIVPTGQPQHRLITALFERRTIFHDSLFYDISSWTLPLAFDLQYAELRGIPADGLGRKLEPFQKTRVYHRVDRKSYAYAFEMKRYNAHRALYRLLKSGVKAKITTEQFQIESGSGKVNFDFGTIMLPAGIQQITTDSLESLLQIVAVEDGIDVHPLMTGMSSSGVDLGSSSFLPVELPRILLLAGDGVSPTDAGEVWHLLDFRFDMEVSLVEPQALNRIDLARYTSVIMVSGSYGSIDSTGRESLRRWVEAGGTLIGMETATEWLVNNRFSTSRFRKPEPMKPDSLPARRMYNTERTHSGARILSGAIFEVVYDRTHPLFYGYEGTRMGMFRSTSLFLDQSRNPYATPAVYSQNPLLSGYIHPDQMRLASNSAAVIVNSLRSGRVILIPDNPNFRGFWFGSNKLFLNTIFFGNIIRGSSARGGE